MNAGVREPGRDRFAGFVLGWAYPWAVMLGMTLAFLAASALDAGGPTATRLIGAAGTTAVLGAVVYPWYKRIRARRAPLPLKRETRIWTGVGSTLVRWARYSIWMVGWFLAVVYIGLALGLSEV